MKQKIWKYVLLSSVCISIAIESNAGGITDKVDVLIGQGLSNDEIDGRLKSHSSPTKKKEGRIYLWKTVLSRANTGIGDESAYNERAELIAHHGAQLKLLRDGPLLALQHIASGDWDEYEKLDPLKLNKGGKKGTKGQKEAAVSALNLLLKEETSLSKAKESLAEILEKVNGRLPDMIKALADEAGIVEARKLRLEAIEAEVERLKGLADEAAIQKYATKKSISFEEAKAIFDEKKAKKADRKNKIKEANAREADEDVVDEEPREGGQVFGALVELLSGDSDKREEDDDAVSISGMSAVTGFSYVTDGTSISGATSFDDEQDLTGTIADESATKKKKKKKSSRKIKKELVAELNLLKDENKRLRKVEDIILNGGKNAEKETVDAVKKRTAKGKSALQQLFDALVEKNLVEKANKPKHTQPWTDAAHGFLQLAQELQEGRAKRLAEIVEEKLGQQKLIEGATEIMEAKENPGVNERRAAIEILKNWEHAPIIELRKLQERVDKGLADFRANREKAMAELEALGVTV
ncbi:MAG: hypothetical protein HOI80_05320 [Alphaproteobacteria bacterium]|jgi:hypothetical protein|nr:hypothetical protein [Alphaproteobacteria bacterium]MBT5389167.1 hypothetical protein [Alphaproteobacteria bacterium]MBT5540096.1 hypothetical protein [Alphaproteobacteria bacterium]MBT5654895.1 hypothetical protein [Alphaproteobacteria bacterium]